MSESWLMIGRGFAGWHAAKHNVSSSGGDLHPYTYCTGELCKGYLAEAAENALVYDASEADENEFVRHVMSGPLVAFDKAPNYTSPCYVGIGVFENLLRAIKGVKVGHVHNGEIIWS